MLSPLSRNTIFHTSPFADNFISEMQQSYASDIDSNYKADVALLKKFYDHLLPCASIHPPIDGHLVIAFVAPSKKEYFEKMPIAFVDFLLTLKVEKVYFLDFLKTKMYDFPFENYRKRNTLKKLLGWNLQHDGFLINTRNIGKVLPLFYFSGRYGRSAITLITQGGISFSLRLCKDGNFHMNFQKIHDLEIRTAAKENGFNFGDVDLCWDYCVSCLA